MKFLLLALILIFSPLNPATAAPVATPLVAELAPHNFRVSREALERDIQDPFRELGTFVAFPSFTGPSGIRLSSFSKDCLLPRFGLRNNDIVQSVNGDPITTPLDIITIGRKLAASTSLRQVKLKLHRGGVALIQTYDLVK